MRDVAEWLAGLGLGQYAELFADNAIDLRALPYLTGEDLKELEIPLGHRRVMLTALPDVGEQPITEGAAERRQLTVLFSDLVGSTALSSVLDPEDMRDVLRDYQDACAAAVARYDGFVAKYMGDGVLVYFGYPTAHEDDAERAINAGLGIVAAVAELDHDLAVRIGIATGTVAVGDIVGEGASEEAAVVGEAPNLAARLQEIAEPGTVVIGEATHALVGGLFEIADLGRRAVKGFADPVGAWAVIRRRPTDSRFDATRGERLTELVGRDEEMEILARRWARATAGEGQVVLISGEPGIGKSRLTREIQDRISDEPHIRLSFQCSPYHTNSALHPVIERLARAAGFEAGESGDARLDKLEAMLEPSGQKMDRIVPLFAALLSVATGNRYPPLRIPPPVQKEMTLKALTDQIAAMASKRPVLLAFEDAHWIDPSTLEFLDLVVEQAPDIAVLALITYRPGFEAPWTDRPRVATMLLGRLERGHVARMVDSVEGGDELRDELRGRIIARSDGVPLFIEELTRSVVEIASDRSAAIEVPATLKDSLESRLDNLGRAKEIAQIGAVIGRSFGYALLSRVVPIAETVLVGLIGQLVRSGLVTGRGEPPHAVYTFKHALIQDTAYGTLLRTRRADLHAAIAQTIEDSFSEKTQTEPEVLARHFSNAGDFKKGARYRLVAGRGAMQRAAFPEAVAQLSDGLKLIEGLPEGPERLRREADLRAALAPAVRASKGLGHPDAEQAYERAYELCRQDPASPHTFPLLWGLWHIRWSRGDMIPAIGDAEVLLATAQTTKQTDHLLIAHCSLGIVLWHNGTNTRALHHIEQSIALYDPKEHAALASSYIYEFGVFARVLLAFTQWSLGQPDKALQTVDEAIAFAQTLNQPHILLFTRCVQGMVLAFRRELSSSVSCIDEGFAEMNANLSQNPWVSLASCFRAWAVEQLGNGHDGAQQLRQSIELWKQTGAEFFLPLLGAMLAETCIACDDLEDAVAIVDEELSRIERTGQDQWRSMVLWTKGDALLAMNLSDQAEAERCYLEAIDFARSQSAKSWELRAATRLARLWHSQGKTAEARDLLAPVYGWFTEGLDTADLRDAKALLDELA